MESSRLVAPLDPRHGLLYELLCLRKKILLISQPGVAVARLNTRRRSMPLAEPTEPTSRDWPHDRSGATLKVLRANARARPR